MRIYLVSDCHHEFWDNHKSRRLEIKDWSDKIPTDIDVLVMAGDIDCRFSELQLLLTKLRKNHPDLPIVYVDGNHEHYRNNYFEVLYRLKNLCDTLGINYLDNSDAVINGVKFYGGCGWTNFRDNELLKLKAMGAINDFRLINGFSANVSIEKNKEFVKNLEAYRPDVVVSHFSPSELGVSPKYYGDELNGYFHNTFEGLIAECKPKLWLHGHIHNCVDYQLFDTRVVANPRGYWNENFRNADAYEGKLIVL